MNPDWPQGLDAAGTWIARVAWRDYPAPDRETARDWLDRLLRLQAATCSNVSNQKVHTDPVGCDYWPDNPSWRRRAIVDADSWGFVLCRYCDGFEPHHSCQHDGGSTPGVAIPERDNRRKDELYDRAQDLDIRGRSTMSKSQLAAAIADAEAQTTLEVATDGGERA